MKRKTELPINQIVCGESLKTMKEWPDACIDLVVTSPRYNTGKDYGNGQADTGDYESYLDFLDDVWNECFRLLIDGGRICINIGDTGRNPYYPVHCDIVSRMRKKWYMMGIVVWDKQTCLSNTAWGSWKSPTSPHLRGQHEYIIIAGKGGKFHRKTNAIKDEWTREQFLEYTREIWRFSPERNRRNHPCPFPLELPHRCIKLYTYLDDIVLDPFCGSGTTCVAAKKLNRRFIGIDINPEYCETSNQRIRETEIGVPVKEQRIGQRPLFPKDSK